MKLNQDNITIGVVCIITLTKDRYIQIFYIRNPIVTATSSCAHVPHFIENLEPDIVRVSFSLCLYIDMHHPIYGSTLSHYIKIEERAESIILCISSQSYWTELRKLLLIQSHKYKTNKLIKDARLIIVYSRRAYRLPKTHQ